MFSLICAWINGWVNNREGGDLRRHRAQYDVTVMIYSSFVYIAWETMAERLSSWLARSWGWVGLGWVGGWGVGLGVGVDIAPTFTFILIPCTILWCDLIIMGLVTETCIFLLLHLNHVLVSSFRVPIGHLKKNKRFFNISRQISQIFMMILNITRRTHYNYVIMTTMASEIWRTSKKHQSSALLAFVWGIHRDRWIPRTKGQLMVENVSIWWRHHGKNAQCNMLHMACRHSLQKLLSVYWKISKCLPTSFV